MGVCAVLGSHMGLWHLGTVAQGLLREAELSIVCSCNQHLETREPLYHLLALKLELSGRDP